jgi:hypothetical protein
MNRCPVKLYCKDKALNRKPAVRRWLAQVEKQLEAEMAEHANDLLTVGMGICMFDDKDVHLIDCKPRVVP